jgi:hypothetical protein
MGINIPQGLAFLLNQILQYQHFNQVFQHVGMVTRVKCMAIAKHQSTSIVAKGVKS